MVFDTWVVLAALVLALVVVGGIAVVRTIAAPPRRRTRLHVAVNRLAGRVG